MVGFDQAPKTEKEQAPAERVTQHEQELKASGIKGLERRIEHNLDPAGMLAVVEVRKRVEEVAKGAGVDLKQLGELTKALHVGAIWSEAERLAEGKDPDVRGWMLLADLTQEENSRDMSDDEKAQSEYLADVERILEGLADAAKDPEGRVQAAVDNIHTRAKDDFIMEDGVAISDNTDAFLSMAINGEVAGIGQNDDLLFVAADKLDYEGVAKELGLKKEVRQEDRGDVTYYVKEGGVEIKVLYPGLSIVFGGDRDLAMSLAKTGQKLAAEKK